MSSSPNNSRTFFASIHKNPVYTQLTENVSESEPVHTDLTTNVNVSVPVRTQITENSTEPEPDCVT